MNRAYKSILLTLAILIALVPAYAVGASTTGETRVKAAIDFAIVVPAIVRVKSLAHPGAIAVEQADVERGYVDLDEATSLVLTSNSRGGYHLAVAFDNSILDSVQVRIAGQRFDIANGSGSVDVRAARLVDAPVRAGYRLFLKQGVRAGNYHWPVALAFSTRVAA